MTSVYKPDLPSTTNQAPPKLHEGIELHELAHGGDEVALCVFLGSFSLIFYPMPKRRKGVVVYVKMMSAAFPMRRRLSSVPHPRIIGRAKIRDGSGLGPGQISTDFRLWL